MKNYHDIKPRKEEMNYPDRTLLLRACCLKFEVGTKTKIGLINYFGIPEKTYLYFHTVRMKN
jgi:hypothetical protein